MTTAVAAETEDYLGSLLIHFITSTVVCSTGELIYE